VQQAGHDHQHGERAGQHASAYSTLKRVLVGGPLATSALEEQRLSKTVGLAVFSSDAVASTAFGTEVILRVLVPVAGMAAIGYLTPLSLLVVGVLVILVVSYRQTIHAYPSGGGSYIVSRENLGTTPALVAGASLLVDYTLTVSVSVAAGVAAITSAIAPLRGHQVALGVALVALIATANLRGVRESGRVFAVPTYGYIAMMGLLIGWGLFRSFTGSLHHLPVDQAELNRLTQQGALLTGVTVFALMKAFASGAVALSGVEAISNGVPAFRRPESRNAAITLAWTGFFVASIFLGVAALCLRLHPTLSEKETILSTLGHHVFGSGPLYGALQATTAAILCLSANTAFADFPRLSSVIAQDRFLPRQLANRGDRLVFSNGIVALAVAAGGLLVAFEGKVEGLIPLFAVGLFASFTLSQAGMVMYHLREREPRWRWNAAVNAVGTAATTGVLVVVLVSKFAAGAWIPTVVIPAVVLAFKGTRRHYERVAAVTEAEPTERLPQIRNTVVVPVGRVTKPVIQAIAYAQALHPDRLVAVSVAFDELDTQRILDAWDRHGFDVPLEVLHSPYRDLTKPVLDDIDRLDATRGDDVITVIIPEIVVCRWWEQFLHNQSALALKARLLFRRNTVVVSVPSHVD
jgi:amino acid transporter